MSDSRASRPRASLFDRITLACVLPVVVAALVELTVVTIDCAPPPPRPLEIWNPTEDRRLADASGAFRADARWLWEPRPGATYCGDLIGPDAYRGPHVDVPRTAGRLRIATLGDSTTFGFGLLEQDGWPRRLEAMLRARGMDVEVVNFGCIGYSLAQGVALYEGKISRYVPDVVICAFGAVNDQFPTTTGLTDAEKIIALTATKARVGSYFSRYATYRWLRASWPRTEAAPHVEGKPVLTKARVPTPDFGHLYRFLNQLVRRSGTLVLVSPPRRLDGERDNPATVGYTGKIHELSTELGLPLADVHRAFRDAERAACGEPNHQNLPQYQRSALFMDQWHPSAEGHELYARTVLAAIDAANCLHRRS